MLLNRCFAITRFKATLVLAQNGPITIDLQGRDAHLPCGTRKLTKRQIAIEKRVDKWILPILIGLLLFLQVPSLAGPVTVLDFEGFPDSTILTNQYAGLAFTNTIILTAGISLNEFEFPPHSGVNVASDNGGPVSISFDSPVLSFGGYFTYEEPLRLDAFDSSSDFGDSARSSFSSNDALFGDPGSSPNEFIQVSFAAGISSVTITGDPLGGSFVMDDVTYTTADVSEPGSVFLFLSGAVALFTFRRKLSFMRRNLLIGGALLIGFIVIGTESWLLAKPKSQTADARPTAASMHIANQPWMTYHSAALGFSIDYPNDGTYVAKLAINQARLPFSIHGTVVDPPPVSGSEVWIAQPLTMFTPDTLANQENFQIYITPDPNILTSMPDSLEVSSSTTVINGLSFQELTVDPEVSTSRPFMHDYAYAIKHNGQYYVFQSTRGPDDHIFDQMMSSMKFE